MLQYPPRLSSCFVYLVGSVVCVPRIVVIRRIPCCACDHPSFARLDQAFPALGVVGYFQSGIAIAKLVYCMDDIPSFGRTWLSLLAVLGHIFYRDGANATQIQYVLDTCEHGITCWSVSLKFDG